MLTRVCLVLGLLLASSAQATPICLDYTQCEIDGSVGFPGGIALKGSGMSSQLHLSSTSEYPDWWMYTSGANLYLETRLPFPDGSDPTNAVVIRNTSGPGTGNLIVEGWIQATAFTGLFGLAPITHAQLVANTDNYAPGFCGTATIWRLSSSLAVNLTGIAVASCFPNIIYSPLLTLVNTGAFDITLKDDTTSTAANRFQLRADFVLKPGYALTVFYDQTSLRWRPFGVDLNDPAPGGGSVNVVEVELDFGAAGDTVVSKVVNGQAWVVAGSIILCTPTLLATADRAEGAEDAVVEGLTLATHSRVAGTSFTLTGAVGGPGLAFGKFLAHCTGA